LKDINAKGFNIDLTKVKWNIKFLSR